MDFLHLQQMLAKRQKTAPFCTVVYNKQILNCLLSFSVHQNYHLKHLKCYFQTSWLDFMKIELLIQPRLLKSKQIVCKEKYTTFT